MSENNNNLKSNSEMNSNNDSNEEDVNKADPTVTPTSPIASATVTPLSQQLTTAMSLNSLPLNRRSFNMNDDTRVTNKTTILRIKRDLNEFYGSNMTSIHVVPEEDNISRVHALIRGPIGTPYSNGFFYFSVQFPADYPIRPPRVKLLTTGRGSVAFNPNLYANGYVCLSILNTWSGPQWSPVMNLTSVLLSIQSLMNEEPYFNEPGREYLKPNRNPNSNPNPSSSETSSVNKLLSSRIGNMSKYYSDVNRISEQFNEHISQQTIRVAVLDMIEETNDSKLMPKPLKDIMFESFKQNYYFYENFIKTKIEKQNQNQNNNSKQLDSNSVSVSDSQSKKMKSELNNSLEPMESMVELDDEYVDQPIEPMITTMYPLMESIPIYQKRQQVLTDSYPNLMKRLQSLKKKFNIQPINEEMTSLSSQPSTSTTTTTTTSSYSDIACHYVDMDSQQSKSNQMDLNVEDIIDDADYYMGTNDDNEDGYDLCYESESEDSN